MTGDRMCERAGCERIGLPTPDRRCQTCGFVTNPWDEEKAAQLRDPTNQGYVHPSFRTGIPVVTTNDLPGWTVTEYVGEVFGLIVRARGAFPMLGADLKSFAGGELATMTNLLRSTRQEAVNRMVEEAEHRGANAVLAMRFDVTTMGPSGGWTEVCAYGTAVVAEPAAPAKAKAKA